MTARLHQALALDRARRAARDRAERYELTHALARLELTPAETAAVVAAWELDRDARLGALVREAAR